VKPVPARMSSIEPISIGTGTSRRERAQYGLYFILLVALLLAYAGSVYVFGVVMEDETSIVRIFRVVTVSSLSMLIGLVGMVWYSHRSLRKS
jgi:hypothetical protein